MNRFFVDTSQIIDSHARISHEDAGHILRVLRLKVNDSLEICDGTGIDYPATIVEIHKEWLRVKLGSAYPSKGEPNVKVTLYQGIPKGSKMELIIQKCVELGVHSIVPLNTARSLVNLSGTGQIRKKIDRWQRIAKEAAKQSKRGIIPIIQDPISFSELVTFASHSIKLIPWEGERVLDLKGYLNEITNSKEIQDANIGMVIGPEGGFSHEEIKLAKEHGWQTITLGPRILRTETAGMCALAAIMFFMEEMK